MRYAIDRLAPEKILLYGDAIPFFDFSGIEVVTYKNSNAERMKKWAEEDQAQAQDVADMAAIVAAAVTMAADFPAEAAAEEADSPAAAEVSAAAVPAVNFNIESDVEKLVRIL